MKTTLPVLRRRPGRTALVLVAAGIAIAGAAAVAVSPDPSREQVIAERSAEVMPFDLAATTHTFEPTSENGIDVSLRNPARPGSRPGS